MNNESVGEGWKTKIREIKRSSEDVIAMLPILKREQKKDNEMSVEA